MHTTLPLIKVTIKCGGRPMDNSENVLLPQNNCLKLLINCLWKMGGGLDKEEGGIITKLKF